MSLLICVCVSRFLIFALHSRFAMQCQDNKPWQSGQSGLLLTYLWLCLSRGAQSPLIKNMYCVRLSMAKISRVLFVHAFCTSTLKLPDPKHLYCQSSSSHSPEILMYFQKYKVEIHPCLSLPYFSLCGLCVFRFLIFAMHLCKMALRIADLECITRPLFADALQR